MLTAPPDRQGALDAARDAISELSAITDQLREHAVDTSRVIEMLDWAEGLEERVDRLGSREALVDMLGLKATERLALDEWLSTASQLIMVYRQTARDHDAFRYAAFIRLAQRVDLANRWANPASIVGDVEAEDVERLQGEYAKLELAVKACAGGLFDLDSSKGWEQLDEVISIAMSNVAYESDDQSYETCEALLDQLRDDPAVLPDLLRAFELRLPPVRAWLDAEARRLQEVLRVRSRPIPTLGTLWLDDPETAHAKCVTWLKTWRDPLEKERDCELEMLERAQ